MYSYFFQPVIHWIQCPIKGRNVQFTIYMQNCICINWMFWQGCQSSHTCQDVSSRLIVCIWSWSEKKHTISSLFSVKMQIILSKILVVFLLSKVQITWSKTGWQSVVSCMRRIQPSAIVEGEKTGCDVNFLSLQIHALFLNNALDLLRSQDRCTGIEISTLQLLAQLHWR